MNVQNCKRYTCDHIEYIMFSIIGNTFPYLERLAFVYKKNEEFDVDKEYIV